MISDYPNQAAFRTCAATGRPLRPGERYFGVLALDGSKFVRRDFSPEGWAGPPPDAFGHWAGRVPASAEAHRPIDDDLLVECFERLDGALESEKLNFRYVVALLLMRRKRLKFEHSATTSGIETGVQGPHSAGGKVAASGSYLAVAPSFAWPIALPQ